ncbi:FMRFamide receptor [Pseudolycoriella hygida]|uniref:FMRFamide receptor n=1 Tax=Pseudolycoriella hygida TaxID=35572 RepID=A0A9Q0RUT4_9DIPT|nr:FMRFamide receptor [Pseudolycoriella hygida]
MNDVNETFPDDDYVVNTTKATCSGDFSPNDNVFDFWMSGVVLNIVGVIGILGNILSMVILSRPQMRSSINYLLIGLARCDTVLIITSMLLFGFRSIYPYTGYLFFYNFYIYPQIVPYVFPLATVAQTASSYLTLMVSLERYVAVCHPLRARALCTYGRSKFYVIFCVVFAVLYNFVKLWETKVVAYDTKDVGLIFCVESTELRKDTHYITIYINWCYLIVNYFIPFLGLLVFNILIYRQVRKANKERQRLSRTEKREIGLATMLLFVVIVFFLFNLLALITNIIEAFYGIIIDELVIVSNLLITLNSSVNFIIYVIFGEKFKRIFLLLFCKGRIGRESPDGLIHEDSSFSNGDGNNRNSGRFSRHGTQRSSVRNGTSLKVTRSVRVRSPAPCVYYPARELHRSHSLNRSGLVWEPKNGGLITSGF